jgi:hypothetical protein
MKPFQLKQILRGAILAALPAAALQMGCGDPCRGPTTRTPEERTISEKISNVGIPLSMEECVKRCRELIEEKRQQEGRGEAGSMEDFKANTCETKLDGDGEGQLDCQADFVSVRTSYTGAPGCPVPGRMPMGLQIHERPQEDALGQYFAQMAAMESAAVTAFRYLVRELEAYDAPEELIQIARDAIEEEIQHAQLASLLAQAYDAPLSKIEVAPFRLRPLMEIALENATEGCIHETFAAACGMWQEEHATLEAFRAVVGRIVDEESRHAALSWALHAWLMPQLSPAERAQILEAQREALDQLEARFLDEAPPSVREAVGLPEEKDAARLFTHLREQLWMPLLV